jgi:peptidoglycan/xylan/chitin deacetylase (PgdA/CDA1 family)
MAALLAWIPACRTTPAAVEPLAIPKPAATGAQDQPPAAQQPETVSEPNGSVQREIAKSYKMNKNYDIVPIDPSGNGKVVLLTFDDGPKEKTQIDLLLAALDKHKAKAIFFVNGYRVQKQPELLKLLHEKGQAIGNHSWDHIDLKKEKAEEIDRQIKDVQQIVTATIGEAPKFFRPPFGSSNDYVKRRVKDEGMLFMTWSNGSEDWLSTNQKPEGVIKRVLEQLHPGSNILMHELPWTAEALDELLTKLEEKGYSFVDPDSIDTALSPFPSS